MSDKDKIVAAFRAEADRLDKTASKYGGFQAVQASLRMIADGLDAEDDALAAAVDQLAETAKTSVAALASSIASESKAGGES